MIEIEHRAPQVTTATRANIMGCSQKFTYLPLFLRQQGYSDCISVQCAIPVKSAFDVDIPVWPGFLRIIRVSMRNFASSTSVQRSIDSLNGNSRTQEKIKQANKLLRKLFGVQHSAPSFHEKLCSGQASTVTTSVSGQTQLHSTHEVARQTGGESQ